MKKKRCLQCKAMKKAKALKAGLCWNCREATLKAMGKTPLEILFAKVRN